MKTNNSSNYSSKNSSQQSVAVIKVEHTRAEAAAATE